MCGPFIHNIDPVIGQILGMYLWWYGLTYTLGFLAVFHWLRTTREFLDMNMPQVYSLSIMMATGVLIGARLVEVFFYEWAFYGEHPTYIFFIWLGGVLITMFKWEVTYSNITMLLVSLAVNFLVRKKLVFKG